MSAQAESARRDRGRNKEAVAFRKFPLRPSGAGRSHLAILRSSPAPSMGAGWGGDRKKWRAGPPNFDIEAPNPTAIVPPAPPGFRYRRGPAPDRARAGAGYRDRRRPHPGPAA